MSVRKQSNGKWMFEKYLEGGRRIRKTFATKGLVFISNRIGILGELR